MSRYEIKWPIGVGGMATVYEALQILPGDVSVPVACKIMREALSDTRYAKLFAQEAALSMSLGHGHRGLVAVLNYFENERGQHHMIMELIRGCSLAQLRKAHAPESLDFAVIRTIAADVLDALAYIHAHQVLHRDISPCNILLSRCGQVKLTDLGLAKPIPEGQGRSSGFRGKPAYASPEALYCFSLDERSDLFSVGAVLYELMAGRPPFGGHSDLDRTIARVVDWDIDPLPSAVPSDLRDLTMGLLQEAPDKRRPASASKALCLLRRLEQPMAEHRVIAELVTPIYEKLAEQRRERHGNRISPLQPGMVQVPDVIYDGSRKTVVADDENDDDDDDDGKTRSVDITDPPRRSRPEGTPFLPLLYLGLGVCLALLISYFMQDRAERASVSATQTERSVHKVEQDQPNAAKIEAKIGAKSRSGDPRPVTAEPAARPVTASEEPKAEPEPEAKKPVRRAKKRNGRTRKRVKPDRSRLSAFQPIGEGDNIHIFEPESEREKSKDSKETP